MPVKTPAVAAVGAVEEADLAAAHALVARGHVEIGADEAPQLGHERLTEAHHLHVGAAARVEGRATLRAPEGQPREAVLEDLLEGEEAEDRLVHARVEAEAALVGAERVRLLDPKAAIDLQRALVVGPADAEADDAVRLDEALEDALAEPTGLALVDGPDGAGDLGDGLVQLVEAGVAPLEALEERMEGAHAAESTAGSGASGKSGARSRAPRSRCLARRRVSERARCRRSVSEASPRPAVSSSSMPMRRLS